MSGNIKYLICTGLLFCGALTFSAQEDEEVIIGEIPQVAAEFPGGEEELYRYMNKKLTRKIILVQEESEKVRNAEARFIINSDGTVDSVSIIKTSNIARVDDLLVNTLKNMPKWKPGELRGKPVRQEFIFPLKIEID